MQTNLPAPAQPARCPVAWCRMNHKSGEPVVGHMRTLGSFVGVAPIKVVLFQPEKNGIREEPSVRVTYGRPQGQGVFETNPELAADFGDLIAALTIQTMADVSAALLRAHDLVGVTEWQVVPAPHPAADTTEGDAR